MQASALNVRAFNESMREVIEEVDFPICVGSHHFTITFEVMDIHPAYSFLLGRQWIHVVDAITYTLHQKLKFIVEDKLVIVCGNEDFVINKLLSFQYVETEEEIPKVPFHYLGFEDVSFASVNQSQSVAAVLSSQESARKTIEKGPLSGWGQIMNIAEKHDHFGLGYHPASRHSSARGCKKFNLVRFSNTGYQYDLSIEMVDIASFSEPTVSDFVHKCPPGFKLDNWTSIVVHKVFLEDM